MNHEYTKKITHTHTHTHTHRRTNHPILSTRIRLFVRFGRVIYLPVCRREKKERERKKEEKNHDEQNS